MMRRLLALLVVPVAFQTPCAAQTTGDSLIVRIEGRANRVLRAADLRTLSRDTLRSNLHHGESFFRRPSLKDVLRVAGVPMDSVRGPTLADYAVFEARDGYRVLFGLSELADDISGRRMLLADEMDGKPLTAFEGPWRLVVPGDLHAARWIRQVTSITIRHAP